MLNNSLKLCFIALLTLGLAFTTACGGDDNDNNGNNSNPDLNNDNNSNPNNSNPNNSNPNNSNPNNSNPNNSNPNNNTGGDNKTFCQENPTAERCTADPAEFVFGAFSKISQFKIAESDCCFDFDGDLENDNGLAGILALPAGQGQPPMMDSVNETIAENIADGTLTLILEHDGLTDLSAGGDYTVNFFLGKYDGDDLQINPASIDQGTQPLAYLPGANLNGTDLKAGPGNVMLSLELFGATLDLSIRQARITADVDEANSSVEEGVALTNGKLGGLIVLNEVYDAVNSFAATCECIPLDGAKLIDYSSGSAVCHDSVGDNATHTCDAEEPCGLIAKNCSLLPAAVLVANQEVDGKQAISVGATFEAEAVTVAGIAAE